MREATVCLREMACVMCINSSDIHMDKNANKNRNWRTRLSYLLKNSTSPRKRYNKPTVDELDQWAQSLDKLLSSRYGRIAFQVFLKSEFCEENLEFWLACEDFQQLKSPNKLASRARSIYEEFIKCESPKEVNLDFYTRDAIEQSLHIPSLSCFRAAQTKVYGLMENNCYPRFILSSLYSDLHTVAKQRDRSLKAQ
ncbi:regulator of G-protein signaling 2-like [Clupea harengus]|uniref:Regulator of G-protein signaling 2-like n=1 Tax=Clupea harengus TaxID=7950 RepID=A0A6P3WCM8_CLUHA|nr:regulator of G-protein signaling 2-like [Clupea harengus]